MGTTTPHQDVQGYYGKLRQVWRQFKVILCRDYFVINQGMDTKDTKVSIIGLERYYQSRKQQAVMRAEEKENPLTAATPSTRTITKAAAIHKEKISLSRHALLKFLLR